MINHLNHTTNCTTRKVLARVEMLIDDLQKRDIENAYFRINEIQKELSVTWSFVDKIKVIDLLQMRDFLKEAITLDFIGHVEFVIGNKNHPTGMWAFDSMCANSTFLYRSFIVDSETVYWNAMFDGNLLVQNEDEHSLSSMGMLEQKIIEKFPRNTSEVEEDSYIEARGRNPP